jgi:homogentisate 1,2-dioxygenase
MPIYHRLGSIPKKRHIAHRKPDGDVYKEELMGNKGFTGPASLLYHVHAPTMVRSVKHLREVRYEEDRDDALRHRHFKTAGLKAPGSCTLDRVPLLFNNDVAWLFSNPDKQDEHFFRNSMGDECYYISDGEGVVESPFGELPYRRGDYVVIPRGILYRFRYSGEGPQRFLITESRGAIRTPKRYRNEFGQLLEGAPYSERDLVLPQTLNTHDEKGDFPIIIKQYGGLSEVILDHHPCDVIGWDGYYYPWAFNIENFEPIVGKIHQPPPVHQTFQGDGFVMCSFCPRPFDFHPEAIPVPYNHSNVMSDEVLYYASSEFMSRKGIEYGSITLHPDGIPHGPHPGRYEMAAAHGGHGRTDEYAVMMDTSKPLRIAKQAVPIEDKEYYKSWLGEAH